MTATGWRLKAKASRSQTRASSDNLCEEENDAVLHLGLCHRPLSLSLSLSLSPSKPPKTKRNKKALAKYKALSVESIAPCADLALRPLVGGLQACPFLFIHLFILPLPPEQTSPVLPPKQTKPSPFSKADEPSPSSATDQAQSSSGADEPSPSLPNRRASLPPPQQTKPSPSHTDTLSCPPRLSADTVPLARARLTQRQGQVGAVVQLLPARRASWPEGRVAACGAKEDLRLVTCAVPSSPLRARELWQW